MRTGDIIKRDSRGRWLPGISGNIEGRPKGSREFFDRCGPFFKWPKLLTEQEKTAITARLGKFAKHGHGGPGRPLGSTLMKKYLRVFEGIP